MPYRAESVSSNSSSEVGGSHAVVAENISVSIEGPRICLLLNFFLPKVICDIELVDEEPEA
ncbi:hypothetical protein AGABI1DRAFT_114763 [Agaricus bisporus var. burnettii JB137-S8]|uniref:Uncharacterized protein n=1 Tax=Agaricus bisporus var. burnettii (strain JB137-S8 / ATCC MYA-4627 / FGSC 10392) TaxID=597362 RepID=K5VVL6_AGABU|nr:uncharacterized protein AGABI1DRAFT_114763 [Agaricus bisporus var. burnettii JB137-S8]EKM78519.1 hypothetical protein AGABI1DRAFT_114763 [Agaricus bisporus var. burnettii JB137-S8]